MGPARMVERLPFREKAGYALGDAACNFYWKTFEFFLLFFYTDVFGLSPAAAGTMFLAVRVIDGAFDPLMGLIADRTQSRWGKFRPFLLWFAVPNAVAAVLTFTTPPFGAPGRLAYAYVTYALAMLMFTAINIPYSALMGVMTADPRERTSISSYRYVGAFSIGLIVVYATKKLVVFLGAGDTLRGWQLTLGLWSVLATGMFIGCFALTRERVPPLVTRKSDVIAELRDLARNGPWLVLFLLSVMIMTTFWIRSATSLYYFKYAVHREDLFEVMAVSCAVAQILGIGLTSPLARVLGGKKHAYMAVMGISSLLTLGYYFISPANLVAIFALSLVISLILGPQSPLLFAMYADTADYSEWRAGRRSTGLIFAAATFALKVGSAFAGWITGRLLAHFGYAANQEQTPESLHGILLLASFVPGLLGIASAALLFFFKLDDSMMQRVADELKGRRDAASSDVRPASVVPATSR